MMDKILEDVALEFGEVSPLIDQTTGKVVPKISRAKFDLTMPYGIDPASGHFSLVAKACDISFWLVYPTLDECQVTRLTDAYLRRKDSRVISVDLQELNLKCFESDRDIGRGHPRNCFNVKGIAYITDR